MVFRKFKYASIVIVSTVCIASLSHFFLPVISDFKVFTGKAIDTKGFTAPTIKPSHFIITVEKKSIIVHINREEQIRYTPHDSAKNSYAIGFYYPCKSVDAVLGLPDLQIDY